MMLEMEREWHQQPYGNRSWRKGENEIFHKVRAVVNKKTKGCNPIHGGRGVKLVFKPKKYEAREKKLIFKINVRK